MVNYYFTQKYLQVQLPSVGRYNQEVKEKVFTEQSVEEEQQVAKVQSAQDKEKPDDPGDQEEEIIEIPDFPGEDKEIEYELTYFVNDSSIKDVEVLMEYGKRGEVKSEYIYGLERVAKSEEGKESQYIYNGRGSVVKELQDKKEVKAYQYGDYGEIVKGKPEQDSVYGYNGENYNSVTELTYLRARYYDPKIGRFIQIDRNYEGESKDSVSQNRYAYTLNNPYKYIDKDGNKNTYNPNGFGYENVTSAYSDRGADLIIKNNKNKSLKEFEKKIKGFTKTQRARAMKAWNNAHPSAKKAEIAGPPAPPGWTQPKKPTNNNTNSTGVVTKPTPTAPKPTPPKTLTNVQATCPIVLTTNNWIELLTACFDWGMIIKDLKKEVVKNLFDVNTVEIMAKHAKGGKIKMGTVISATKAKDLIRDIKSVPKSSLSTIIQTIRGSVGEAFLGAVKNSMSWISVIVNWAGDVIGYGLKAMFGLITFVRFLGSAIGSVIYQVLKEAAIATIRVCLTPFIGPFAWLVGMLADYGFSLLKHVIDIEGVCNDIGEWMIKSAYDSIATFASTISKIL